MEKQNSVLGGHARFPSRSSKIRSEISIREVNQEIAMMMLIDDGNTRLAQTSSRGSKDRIKSEESKISTEPTDKKRYIKWVHVIAIHIFSHLNRLLQKLHSLHMGPAQQYLDRGFRGKACLLQPKVGSSHRPTTTPVHLALWSVLDGRMQAIEKEENLSGSFSNSQQGLQFVSAKEAISRLIVVNWTTKCTNGRERTPVCVYADMAVVVKFVDTPTPQNRFRAVSRRRHFDRIQAS